MSESAGQVVRLRAEQITDAAKVSARAFRNDPMMKFLLGSKIDKEGILPWFTGVGIRYGHMYGEVYTTDDLAGVAVWAVPGRTEMSYWQMFRAGAFGIFWKAGWGAYKRLMRYSEENYSVHRELVPGRHWYLFSLAVDPDRQRGGVGGGLMRPVLKKADEEGLVCYLEVVREELTGYYERFGFEVSRKVETSAGPDLWAMIRKANSGK